MWNVPSKARLAKIPGLYDTEKIPLQDKEIHLHFFIAGCDWYISEFDGEDLFWGFANLGDDQCAEWGYISFSELKSIKVQGYLEIDSEFAKYFPVQKAINIEKLRIANGWHEPVSPENHPGEEYGIHT